MTDPYAQSGPVYRGFAEQQPDLYEFRTDNDMDVYLHDLKCVSVAYLPLMRTLTLTFNGNATELVSAMTVTMTFAGAEVLSWRSTGVPATQEVIDAHPRVLGQVGTLITERRALAGSEVTQVSFHLALLDLAMSFTATDVSCEVDEEAAQTD